MTVARNNIDAILADAGVLVEKIEHPPVFTCEEADKYTPNPTEGIKTLLAKTKSSAWLACVLRGNQRLDFKAIQKITGEKAKFATQEEAVEIIGCEPGAIPPFGQKNKVQILVDTRVFDGKNIYFNPGVNTRTYGISVDDFRRIITNQQAIVGEIAQQPKSASS